MFGDFAPACVGFPDDVPFGDLWKRSELGPGERSLITVAALGPIPWWAGSCIGLPSCDESTVRNLQRFGHMIGTHAQSTLRTVFDHVVGNTLARMKEHDVQRSDVQAAHHRRNRSMLCRDPDSSRDSAKRRRGAGQCGAGQHLRAPGIPRNANRPAAQSQASQHRRHRRRRNAYRDCGGPDQLPPLRRLGPWWRPDDSRRPLP